MECVRVFRAAGGALVVAAVLAGCSGEQPAASSHLPERTCFGTFTRSDLEPLMGPGKTVKEMSPIDARLTATRREASCEVVVDGEHRVSVAIRRQPLGESFFFQPDPGQPAPDLLPLGDRGYVWDTGAFVTFTCQGAQDSFGLELTISGSVEHMKRGTSRPHFTGLMTKLMDVAKQQTQCGT